MSFDEDLNDHIAPIELTLPYSGGPVDFGHSTHLRASTHILGFVNGTIDHWSIVPHRSLGDFNDDGILDAADIDHLTAEIATGNNDIAFDLSGDEVVDEFDRNIWITDLRNTWFGDANMDSEFNSSDLVQVFQAGEYEDTEVGKSTWSEGDWSGDGEFNSRDLVLAFQNAGYEKGPLAETAVVPEPNGLLLMLTACTFLSPFRRS